MTQTAKPARETQQRMQTSGPTAAQANKMVLQQQPKPASVGDLAWVLHTTQACLSRRSDLRMPLRWSYSLACHPGGPTATHATLWTYSNACQHVVVQHHSQACLNRQSGLGLQQQGHVQYNPPATLDLSTSYKVADRFCFNAHQLGEDKNKMHPLGCAYATCM